MKRCSLDRWKSPVDVFSLKTVSLRNHENGIASVGRTYDNNDAMHLVEDAINVLLVKATRTARRVQRDSESISTFVQTTSSQSSAY